VMFFMLDPKSMYPGVLLSAAWACAISTLYGSAQAAPARRATRARTDTEAKRAMAPVNGLGVASGACGGRALGPGVREGCL